MSSSLPIITQPTLIPETSGSGEGQALPQIQWIDRPGTLLHSTPLGGGDDVLGLNLSRGCVHRCTFCSVRASPRYLGDRVVKLYHGVPERLDLELTRMQHRPRAVYLSPGMDPFPALDEVQEEALRVVEVLAHHGVEAWLMTRGLIRPTILQRLVRFRDQVKITVALTTCDARLQDVLEPLTAAPTERLRQVAELQRLGFAVQAALDPLLPGLTDTADNLNPVLESLALAGVRQLTAGYLFLREGIAENLRRALEPHGWSELVLNAFKGGPLLTAPGLAAARYLPRGRRQRGYATLMALAANHGLSVTISSLTNPDFSPARPATETKKPSLLALYLKATAAVRKD